ncbi:sodium:calcium antiporter [Echinicola jeungdonensis]|uniref:Sodium:calcium antiporter n=1 Tax=Echinicola jeungdonensis TaxID=709343 RepID=A0ABV5J524_9BACT|nr:sodium:calcium antiporter [Echinicola jeungdonensis]MDN3668223.1 sodium:calcium antiporter [Echinicola jeungdonensis]
MSILKAITDSLELSVITFILMSIVIAIAGTKLTKVADKLADITGIGEAFMGGVMLGAMTSLPGSVTSISVAIKGFPELAVSNGLGGIVAQTAFIGIADIAYKKANLEHASASIANLMFGVLLILLLAFILIVSAMPEYHIIGIHPASFLLIFIYLAGLRMVRSAQKFPMWRPRITSDTEEDESNHDFVSKAKTRKLWVIFSVLAITVAFAGFMVAQTGVSLAEKTGFSETFVGTFFTAISTSLPELMVSVAAVRQRAVTLAVSNIIGGNAYDVLFVSFSDFAYTEGSIYHEFSGELIFVLALTIFMNAILILGMLDRETKGFAKIGWEGVLILFSFVSGFVVLYLW